MIQPGAMLGLLGGGQLGRMFTQAALRMGFEVAVLDPDPASPAGRIATRHLHAAYTDQAALRELGGLACAVTTEFENVPADSLAFLRQFCPVRPGPEAVQVTQDREAEKTFARTHGLDTAPFHPILREADCAEAFRHIKAPALLKTSRLGYDGKGQAGIGTLEELVAAFRGFGGQPCVLEARLDLDAEISVVLARGTDGSIVTYPVAENRHVQGILDTSVVPARVPEALAAEARAAAARLATAMDYVGTMAVEFFVVGGGRLVVNEMAPRPHNSGHYTLDACATDQFEQQVRAVAGLPLGDTSLLRPATMVNLLGDLWAGGPPRWDRALADPGVHLHLYGKTEPRPGRKMGHLTVLAGAPELALAGALAARQRLTER
ncbi:MAG: 5-(carboxyamino)imidazole ribonucleotide synthase [Gemmatimonadetes bacterium]|nr:5-(carboxyamino)imidazole ribonucleotide synthase [Gemmatimonadota bacterium]MBK9692757.1 5-(carboxyamino)imidazole ribonucleotide synthase [Gemmatimonadota bacterium]